MAEQPPLSRIHVVGYSANDRDYPILNLVLDPRVAGYQVPKDLSACPDKRYPNHVFTGAQPISGDQRVRHVWEILPSPYVPFTRYDDDLGPVQGRRRSVKNEGQVATRQADKQVTYDAREGSAIVYTELEETWSIATDDDGNSLFPIRDRDFYDPSRGPVQERRQLFTPTGEEEGSLENVNGVITQTSYEPYNEFLSVKVIQTYKVDGPQLIGRATDNDGQLITVTTQRKGADSYIPPNPTATRTVEVNREDAESLVERIVDTPEVFKANTFSVERPDPIPQKFRVAVPIQSSQEIVEGDADPNVSLSEGELSKSEEQRNKFIKRVSSTSRDQAQLPITLTQKSTNNNQQLVLVTQTLQQGDDVDGPSATQKIQSEALGDGNYIITKENASVFGATVFRKTKEDLTPQKFKALQENITIENNTEGSANSGFSLALNEFSKSEEQVNQFVKRVSTTSRSTASTPPLTEFILTQQGQIGTRTLTLSSGPQTISPNATLLDGNVEALGDGRTLKTEVRVVSVFPNKTITKSKIDLTPEKFKAKQEDTTIEESVAGTIATNLNLAAGDFRKSEEQVTQFVKRTSTTTRDTTASDDLEEFVLTPQRQLATRTLRLSSSSQTIQPDARLIDGSIEELGDGRTIKTEVRVENTFDEKTVTIERPDLVPSKFRENKIETTEDFVFEDTNPVSDQIEFGSGEYRKTEQRLTEFTKRQITNKKDDSKFENLEAVDYDESFGIKIPFTESITTSIPQSVTADVESLGDGRFLVRDYDLLALAQELQDFFISYPTRASLNLPKVLKSITVEWDYESQTGEFENENEASGSFKSISLDDRGSVSATLAATPKFNIDIEEIWAQNLQARTSIFFLQGPINEEDILNRVGASSWPIFKPQSHTITAVGKKLVGSASSSVSSAEQITDDTNGTISSSSGQIEKSISTTSIIVNIPACLNSEITIDSSADSQPIAINATAKITAINPISKTTGLIFNLEAEINEIIPATSPTDVPRSGTYLIDSDVEFFKFGWFIVKATTIDAGQLE